MAAKKKGLSVDEKRQRLLDMFFEKKEFFQMKELERIAPKEKGIVSQSVKEITQMLVDDGLVDCEKIGTFVCYWAFPSKALQSRRVRLEKLSAQLTEMAEKRAVLEQEIATLSAGKEETEERAALLVEVTDLRQKKVLLETELEKFREFDPEVISDMKKKADEAVEAANRWADNVEAVKGWCKAKFQIPESQLNKQFELPEEFECLE